MEKIPDSVLIEMKENAYRESSEWYMMNPINGFTFLEENFWDVEYFANKAKWETNRKKYNDEQILFIEKFLQK
jgi:hypothetical protein